MTTTNFVELAAARDAKGVRIVVPAAIPSPWSQAAIGLFRVARVPTMVVRGGRDAPDVAAWTKHDNYPVVFHDGEPVRTNWAAIVALAARLAPASVLPIDTSARAEVMGMLDVIAGEDGLGWNARLFMIDVGLKTQGARGFSAKVSAYLAARYGHREQAMSSVRAKVSEQLHLLEGRLGARAYFGGDATPNAVDVYAATFLTPFAGITEADCPGASKLILTAFAASHEELASLVPPSLFAHRKRMLEEHLGFPISV